MVVVLSERKLLKEEWTECDDVMVAGGSSEPVAPDRLARARLDKGEALAGLGQHDEAAACLQ
jgi:hypothetical protein